MDIKRIHFKIEGIAPIAFAQFHGQEEEEKIKKLPIQDRCEKHLYRTNKGTIAIPSSFVTQCLGDEYILETSERKRREQEFFVRPRIQVSPIELDTKQKDYTIRTRSVPIKKGNRIVAREIAVSPKLEEWTVEGTLLITLPGSIEDLKQKMENAGVNIGLGEDRKHGYGRFKVIEFATETEQLNTKKR